MARPISQRTAFLHIGGSKTGSATIQKVMFDQPLPDHHYVRTGTVDRYDPGDVTPNHSPFLSLLFGRGNNRVAPYFRRRGWTPVQLKTQRKAWLAELTREIEDSDKDLIFSAERLCSPSFDEASLTAFRTFLETHVGTIRVIGYVRSPVSYCQSSFQQRLKGVDPVSLELSPIRYIKRFQKFDTVFGRANVTLCHYNRSTLSDGDVVVDFARHLGVSLVDYTRTEINTSLSLEAVAVLYAGQHFGRKIRPSSRYDADTRALLQALRKLDRGKLAFGPAILEPMLKKCAHDIDWMETRLGVVIRDAPETGAQVISSENDLLAVAANAQTRLEAVLTGEILGQGQEERRGGAQNVARLMDVLRETVSERRTDTE